MDLLSAALILVGVGCLAVGVGRAIAFGAGVGETLPDSAERRRALIRAEHETADDYGWR